VINWTTLTRGLLHNKYEWWHDFQHGIGIIGHCAPLSYVMGIRVVYIASSYPASMKGQYTCASDPTIDNYMKYARCITIHDGYELNRQEKVRYLLQQTQKLNKKIHLHVCWETTSGENCCHCEKCYRTILEIVSEGGNPNEYGFKWDSAAIVEARKMFTYKITSTKFNIDQYYPPIQERLKVNKDCIPDYDLYRWLVDYDFSNFNRHVSKYIYNNRVVRKLRTIIAKR
jgi:hypothetical protein